MKAKYFLFILLTFSTLSLCLSPFSIGNSYSLGVDVDDIFTWKITHSTTPYAEGRTMTIKIDDIENETDAWRIYYYLKSWADYDYDGSIHFVDIGKECQYLLSYFCPMPVLDYLQEFNLHWHWKDYSTSENSIMYQYLNQKWTYDTKSGILISYSSIDLTYKLNSSIELISGYDLTVFVGLFAIITVVFIHTIIKKESIGKSKVDI